jgi:hypothetical protein
VNKTESFGIIQNLPFEEYLQMSGLNQSTLKQWFSSAQKKTDGYKNYQALQFGSAGHCLLLEPEMFTELYVRAPEGLHQRGKTGKKRWVEFAEQHPGKIVLRTGEWERLENIRKVFEIHPQIQKLWVNGVSEVSLFWQDSEFDLNCKARLDWFDPASGIIVDLKFTNNIGKACVQKPIQDYYALQASWYMRAVTQLTAKVPEFFFVFIEKYAPHLIRVCSVSAADLKYGQQKTECAIKNLSNNIS